MIKIPKYEEEKDEIEKIEEIVKKETNIDIPNIENITEADMYSGLSFCFGKRIKSPHSLIEWNPMSKQMQNANMMIIGGSGSGKTRLLKQIIKYLGLLGIDIIIFDLHGDIITPNETCFRFTIRNSEYGVSMFPLNLNPFDGGPVAKSNTIVAIFRKDFIKNMGPIQKSVLLQFIIDCYRFVGIFDEDESTWRNKVPTVATLLEVYSLITESVYSKGGYLVLENYRKMEELKKKMKDELDEGIIDKLRKRVDKLIVENETLHSSFCDYILKDTKNNIFSEDIINNISLKFYREAENIKTLKKLAPYFRDLASISIFNDKKPPATKGTVRFDMSGLTNEEKPLIAMLLTDITIQEVFRECKQLGETNTIRKVGIIDESKIVLPSGKDKENPYNIYNRIVTESRKYGFFLVIVSQRPGHFSQEMISSIFTKVVLNINENDATQAKKDLGIKPDYLFNHLRDAVDGAILVGQTGGLFTSVATAWYKI